LSRGGLPALFALDLPTRRIEDDSSLRIAIRDTWLTEVPGRMLNNRPFIHTLPGGGGLWSGW
jgi:hypothetical protein